VALFDLIVYAPSEGLDLSIDSVEAVINFCEVLVDGREFGSARICESFDETVDVSEAGLHAGSHLSESFIDVGKAFLDSLFHSIEAVPKIDFCHMLGVYHSVIGSRAGSLY
jgi:hypothetical protein